MKVVILAFTLFFTLCDCRSRNIENENEIESYPDIFHNVSLLISSKGYPVEDHTVQTTDGFILSLQRIPHGRNCHFGGDKKQAVFLQHGLLDSSADWVLNFPEQSLGFILADAGYDVWLGNTRGNTYSRRHLKYKPNQKKFWDFSFDEMAKYDLPAMIDYVLNATGEEKLYYVGHSQGTSAAFALLSESPEYNEKIKLFIALGPVTTVGYTTNVLRYLVPFRNDIAFLLEILGLYEFRPSCPSMKVATQLVSETVMKSICEDFMFMIAGTNRHLSNETRIGVYSAHIPSGSSVKSIIHYAQLVDSKSFTKFDYGKKGNMERYDQMTPPEYDVSRITTPVALVWSMSDQLADPVDVDILQGKLKSMVSSYVVPFPEFKHMDFVMAVDAPKLLYDHVLSLLTQHFVSDRDTPDCDI